MRRVKLIACFFFAAMAVFAQGASNIKGQVADESGAVIPGAQITVSNAAGAVVKQATTKADGSYAVAGLPPGDYSVKATAPGLIQREPAKVRVAATGSVMLNLELEVAAEKQEVTVQETEAPAVSVDPQQNAGAIVFQGKDLESLSDDPDDLQQDLEALAGPSAGPNGGQIYIDGFTGGRLPPKESIREIRINQNPFSSEYDALGYGRIEILTKPGSDKFHGQMYFNTSDMAFDARNPFLQTPGQPEFQTRQYGGYVGGPMNKRSSFFIDFERRDINDSAIVNASTLDSNLNPTVFNQAVSTPQERTTFSPRVDYQLSTNNTLTARYTWMRTDVTNAGVGVTTLPSAAYNSQTSQQTAQLVETAVLNPKTINETRFQYIRQNLDDYGNTTVPGLAVAGAFTGGGAQIGRAYDYENHYEIQNYTTITSGRHTWKFGVRLRTVTVDNASPQNFGGTFTFAGGLTGPELDANNQPVLGPDGNPVEMILSSLEQYRRTLLFQQLGYSAPQIRSLGGGASLFTLAAGNPLASVNQTDVGLFVQDDWKLRPNLTLSLGLRWEDQTNIQDRRDFAPRLGIAWAPGQGKHNARPSTVFRGGVGIFYDRFSDSYTLQAERYNGILQQQYVVANPDFFPTIPAVNQIQNSLQHTAITEVDQHLRAPYLIQSAIGVDRQLPLSSTLSVNFTDTHALHLLLMRDINAPLPGTGVRPYGNVGEIDEFESAGLMNQQQLFTRLNTRISSSFSMFAGYVFNHAMSNTDGAGSYPANQYDLTDEYARSSLDIRHRIFLAGSFSTRWNIRISPFLLWHSGVPFNITLGQDIFGDAMFNGRPVFANPGTPGAVTTPWGVFSTNVTPGEVMIPRNYGDGPGALTLNLRIAKTFGFGGETADASVSPLGGGGHGGRMGGGFHSLFGDTSTGRRYNLTIGLMARNLLNDVNPSVPIGNLSSPNFGESLGLSGGYGASSAVNRRIEIQTRFTF